MKKTPKTNAVRFLEKNRIPHREIVYESNGFLDGPLHCPKTGATAGTYLQNPGHRGKEQKPLRLCPSRPSGTKSEKSRGSGQREVGGNDSRQRHHRRHRLCTGRLQSSGNEKTIPHRSGSERPAI